MHTCMGSLEVERRCIYVWDHLKWKEGAYMYVCVYVCRINNVIFEMTQRHLMRTSLHVSELVPAV